MEELKELPIPRPGDRVCFMGNTGEGKSVLAASLLLSIPNAIIVNTKDDPFFAQPLLVERTIRNDDEILNVGEGRFNYVPTDDFQDDSTNLKRALAYRNRFFEQMLAQGHRAVYIDEFTDICPSAQLFPYKFQKCVKQGRWRQLGIWGTSQEPIGVPRWCWGQAQHRYLFFAGWDEHRKLAERWFQTRIPWEEIPEESHKFILKVPGGTFGPQPPINTPLNLDYKGE